jgi:hypothetical protein
MPRIKMHRLNRISVNEIVYDDIAIKQLGNLPIVLQHVEDNTIGLFVNGQDTGWRAQVYERVIKGRLRRNGYIPQDRRWCYYAYGPHGKRCRYLYLLLNGTNSFNLGTRTDFNATYLSSCHSHRQRRIAKECNGIRRQKRRERKPKTYPGVMG